METRKVIGKKIKRVSQTRRWSNNQGRWIYDVSGLILEDGTVVSFHTAELEGDYATIGTVRQPERS